jgi:hypothetical protein
METTINLLISGSLTLLGMALGHYVTKRTHIFQKSYERKSDLIIELYRKVVRLELALKKYVHFTGAERGQDSIGKKIQELNNIKKDFHTFQHKFWEVEIILEDSSIEKINKFLQSYGSIISNLSVSNISQQLRDNRNSFDNWDKSFQSVSNDLAKIKEDLKNEFKQELKK